MFAVGHLAFGYVLSKTSAKLLKTKLNIPLALTLSVIQDIDILVPFLEHRGPTHSIIASLIIFAPILAVYRKKATPYLTALIQHSLIGDYIAGSGTQLLWPITTQRFGTGLSIKSQMNITIELVIFFASMIIMLKTMDTATLLQPHNSNLILTIPTFTALLPTFLSFPIDVPASLILPHLVYMAIFLASIAIDLRKNLKHPKEIVKELRELKLKTKSKEG
jgi:membrane-bound metal-dependent hydrolase YbcI (DUF457 family)